MNKLLDVFVLRHAVPLDMDYDPGIGREEIPKIKQVAQTISEIAEDGAHFTIFTSPARRTMETANVLSRSEQLGIPPEVSPTPHQDLSEMGVNMHDPEDRPWIWTNLMSDMSRRAIMRTADQSASGLIVVTHEPVIRTIPFLSAHPNTDHLAINHFQYPPIPAV
jgi:broad specificity phosphatase PhoE